MSTFGSAVIWCSIQVTLASAVGAIVYLLARRAGPALRARIVLASLIVVLVLSGFALSPWPRWSPGQIEATVADSTQTSSLAAPTESPSDADVLTDTVAHPAEREGNTATETDSEVDSIGSHQDEAASSSDVGSLSVLAGWRELMSHLDGSIASVEPAQDDAAWSWIEICGVVFIVSALIAFVQLLIGYVNVVALRRGSRPLVDSQLQTAVDELRKEMGLQCEVSLCESADVGTPATMGIRHPVILLPTEWRQWNESERATVLAHELTHIQRSDFVARLVAQFGLAVHFYHPLVHWLVGRLRLEQELAADTGAARVAGGRRQYLSTLAEMALRLQDRFQPAGPSQRFLHTFLPSKDSFLRRIEMLRESETWTANPSRAIRMLCLAAVLMAGFAAVGIRGVTSNGSAVADEPTDNPKSSELLNGDQLALQTTEREIPAKNGAKQDRSGLSLSFVPAKTVMVIAIRPSEVLGLKGFEPLAEMLRKEDAEVADLDQLLQVFAVGRNLFLADGEKIDRPPVQIGTIFHSSKPNDFRGKTFGLPEETTRQTYKGMKYRTASGGQSFHIANGRTLVSCSTEDNLKLMLDSATGPKTDWAKAWKRVSNNQAAVAVNLSPIQDQLSRQLDRGPTAMIGMLRPLWEQSEAIVGGAHLDEHLTAQVSFIAGNAEDATAIKTTLEAAMQLARNMMVGFKANLQKSGKGSPPPGMIKPAQLVAELTDQTLKNAKVSLDGNSVVVTSAVKVDVTQHIRQFVPAILTARSQARQAQSMNNLKQIGLAMHNYAAKHDHFPPAVLMGEDGNGKHPHSWRVAILPFIDQADLYNAYHFDEPWDSEHNQQVTSKMPSIYRHPSQAADSTDSDYYVFTGDKSAFRTNGVGVGFRDILDGLANTILAVESKRKTHWAKPDDIVFDPKKDVPKLGGFDDAGFNTVLCDGAARFLKKSVNQNTLKLLIQIADGQIIKPGDIP